MQELLTFVAQSLVEHPDQVSVTETEGPEAVILELHVAEDDMGKVIGKQGRIAKAIRAVIKPPRLKTASLFLLRFNKLTAMSGGIRQTDPAVLSPEET